MCHYSLARKLGIWSITYVVFGPYPVGALGALLAGVAWIVEGLLTLVMPEQGPEAFGSPSFYLSNVVFVIAFIGTLAGLIGLHARQAPSYGRIGRAGLVAALVGVALMLVAVVISIVAGRPIEVVEGVFGIAILATFVGFVLYGAATQQARVLPRWSGVALIIALLFRWPWENTAVTHCSVLCGWR